MSILDKVLNFIGFENEADVKDEEVTERTNNTDIPSFDFSANHIKTRERKAKISVADKNDELNYELVVMRLRSFEEAKQISDHLLQKKSVIINLENLEKDVAKRILDFLSGTIYTIFGNIQKISNGIFLLTPEDIGVLDGAGTSFKI